MQNCGESLKRERVVGAGIVGVGVVAAVGSRPARVPVQDPTAITIHDRTELRTWSESKSSESSTDVNIAGVLRSKGAEVARIRGRSRRLVDESLRVP